MRKIIIIMALALVAFTAMAAPGTAKKWSWSLQKAEQRDSYGLTPVEVLEMFNESIHDMDQACVEATASIECELEREALLLEMRILSAEQVWSVYNDTYGDTLRKNPDVWKVFLDAGYGIAKLKNENMPKIEAVKRLIYNY